MRISRFACRQKKQIRARLPLGFQSHTAFKRQLAKSRIGIVFLTPSLLKRLPSGGVADKELSVLLQRDQLVPIIHNSTYDAPRG